MCFKTSSHRLKVAVTKVFSLLLASLAAKLQRASCCTVVLLVQAESPATMSSRCFTPKDCNYVTTTNKTKNKSNQQTVDDSDELQQHTDSSSSTEPTRHHQPHRIRANIPPSPSLSPATACPPLRHSYRRHCRPTAAYTAAFWSPVLARTAQSYCWVTPEKCALTSTHFAVRCTSVPWPKSPAIPFSANRFRS
jgi:hypothetical protein